MRVLAVKDSVRGAVAEPRPTEPEAEVEEDEEAEDATVSKGSKASRPVISPLGRPAV